MAVAVVVTRRTVSWPARYGSGANRRGHRVRPQRDGHAVYRRRERTDGRSSDDQATLDRLIELLNELVELLSLLLWLCGQ